MRKCDVSENPRWEIVLQRQLTYKSKKYAPVTRIFSRRRDAHILASCLIFGLEHDLTSLSLKVAYIKARLKKYAGLTFVILPLVLFPSPSSPSLRSHQTYSVFVQCSMHSFCKRAPLSNELEFAFSKISFFFFKPFPTPLLTINVTFITKFSKFNKDIEINAQIQDSI